MMKFNVKKKLAMPISYGKKRSRNDIKYIVIHYTGNKGDTAQGNANYFAMANQREAGAHFFVGQKGQIYKSINMNRTAWAVGGDHRTGLDGEAEYYKKCTNANSVSIELCDNATKDPSAIQKEAVKWLIENYIQKYCKNAKVIIRHWDVNGKQCPARMTGKDNKKWKSFLKYIRS